MLKKILVVDDSALIHQMYRLVMSRYNCTIADAMNGQEALDILAVQKDVELVLLDINMPVMNGLQFLEKASAVGILRKIPVIIVSLHNAIGTSAAIGFPIALAGAAGYVVNGLAVDSLPPHSLGFVYLPALLGVAVVSVLTAPFGARLAHSLPVAQLKKAFAFLLIVMGTKMLMTVFQ